MKELRCSKCNRLLLKYQELGTLQIKCPRCGEVHENVIVEDDIEVKNGVIQPPKMATYIKQHKDYLITLCIDKLCDAHSRNLINIDEYTSMLTKVNNRDSKTIEFVHNNKEWYVTQI